MSARAKEVRKHHSRKGLKIAYDATHTTWNFVHDLLQQAGQVGKAWPVAKYLVGAHLQLRFPKIAISNDRCIAADLQTGGRGCFRIGDTVFHVTLSAFSAVYEQCRHNLADGWRVFLLVPYDCLADARHIAQALTPGQIAVESVESFVANGVEWLATFAKDQLVSGLRQLLETYNRRVNSIELDESLLTEIPPSLA